MKILGNKLYLSLIGIILVLVFAVAYVFSAVLDQPLTSRPVEVKVELAQTGGLFEGSAVTYRGIKVGKVRSIVPAESGVVATVAITSGTGIPKDSLAKVRSLSPVGEQYLDFQPRNADGPYAADGARYQGDADSLPVDEGDLLVDLSRFVDSVDKESLQKVVKELGVMFGDTGRDLQRLLDGGSTFIAEASEHTDETIALLDNSLSVLRTQRGQKENIRSFAADLNTITTALRGQDQNLKTVLSQTPGAARAVDRLLKELEPTLPVLLGNLVTTNQILVSELDGIEQLLVTYPDVVTGGFSVVPGDGTAHFGLVLNVDDPKACEAGYEGTTKIDPHRTTGLPPVNLDAHCAASRGSGVNVRGAQNAPKPTRGGQSGQSYPMAFGATPVALGNRAVTSGSPSSLSVQSPVAPTGDARTDNGTSWLWMMQEALR